MSVKKIFLFGEKDLQNLKKTQEGLGCRTQVEAVRVALKQAVRRFK